MEFVSPGLYHKYSKIIALINNNNYLTNSFFLTKTCASSCAKELKQGSSKSYKHLTSHTHTPTPFFAAAF